MIKLPSALSTVMKMRWLAWGLIAAAVIGAILLLPGDPGRAPTAPSPVRVEVASVKRAPVVEFLAVEGLAQASRKAFLQFERDGRVAALGVDSAGQTLAPGARVRRGQMLAALEPREASAQVAQAEAAHRQARQDLERQSQLQAEGLASRAQREAAEAEFARAEAALREARLGASRDVLYAPFDAVVTALNVKIGDATAPQPSGGAATEREASAAIVLAADGALDIAIEVAPEVVVDLKVGQPALVGLRGIDIEAGIADGGTRAAPARVLTIARAVSLRTRAVPITLRVDEPPPYLLDGLLVQAFIETRRIESAIAAPQRALIPRGERTFAFVLDPASSQVARREVEVGALGLNDAEIISGLAAGDQVVVTGQHLLTDGASVLVVAPSAERVSLKSAP